MPANFISRDDLRNRLADRSEKFPLTLVCAPAGYGKTTLLADWIENTDGADKAWVSLDGGDNDAGRFWTAVLDAVRACASVPSDSPLRLLNPDAADIAAGFEAGFVAEVIDTFAALPAPLYLVLDDTHDVLSEQTWHGVATLVRHQPANLRLVLSTRADPPLPLARLRVQGDLAELRMNELRFTRDQAAELLRMAGVGLDDDQLDRLVAQTEGWPAGLRLAARSLRNVSDPEAFLTEFAGHDRATADFLVGEVLTRLPAATADVLTLVSVCDEVTPALAAALTRRADAGAILAGLERDSSLVLGVGQDRQWFRTHPLLRSYLLADLARHRPHVLAELHEIATAWFAARQRPDKAFDHVALAGEHQSVVDMLYRHAPTVLLTGNDNGSVRRALTEVGADTVAANPALTLISALAHMVAGDHAQAEADLAGCRAMWPAAPDADLARLRHLVTTTWALAGHRPPPATWLDWSEIIAAYEGTDLEAWARAGHGWALRHAGPAAGARGELEVAVRLTRDHGFEFLRMLCLSALAEAACLDGGAATAETACVEALRIAHAHGWTASPWLCADHLVLGFARLLSLDPAGALDEARQAAAALRTGSATEPESAVLHYLIDVLTGAAYTDTGRWQEGLALLRQARHDHDDQDHRALPAAVLAAAAVIEHRCALDLGNTTLARQVVAWVRERVGDVAELELMRAWTAFGHGALHSTELAVRNVLDGPRPALCATTHVEARLLETALEIRLGRRTKALAALNAALERAEQESLVRPFRHAEVAVRQLLLEQVGGFGRLNGFASRTAQLVSTMEEPEVDMLTTREHAVLSRLSSPQSLDELATDMSVSVNTVKTHVRAIYAKLGVKNRRAAVVAGRRMGLSGAA